MKRLNKMVLAMAAAGGLSSGVAQAALIDRGGGLLYDNVLNVTWLQDANYAQTSGYDNDGRMNWNAAVTWTSSLDISRFAGESLSGWRLASNSPVVPGDWNANFSYDGSTNMGYNITSPNTNSRTCITSISG